MGTKGLYPGPLGNFSPVQQLRIFYSPWCYCPLEESWHCSSRPKSYTPWHHSLLVLLVLLGAFHCFLNHCTYMALASTGHSLISSSPSWFHGIPPSPLAAAGLLLLPLLFVPPLSWVHWLPVPYSVHCFPMPTIPSTYASVVCGLCGLTEWHPLCTWSASASVTAWLACSSTSDDIWPDSDLSVSYAVLPWPLCILQSGLDW